MTNTQNPTPKGGIPEAIDRLVKRKREPLIALLKDIHDRLEDRVDVVDGDGRQFPNFAMSIRMDIEALLASIAKEESNG